MLCVLFPALSLLSRFCGWLENFRDVMPSTTCIARRGVTSTVTGIARVEAVPVITGLLVGRVQRRGCDGLNAVDARVSRLAGLEPTRIKLDLPSFVP